MIYSDVEYDNLMYIPGSDVLPGRLTLVSFFDSPTQQGTITNTYLCTIGTVPYEAV